MAKKAAVKLVLQKSEKCLGCYFCASSNVEGEGDDAELVIVCALEMDDGVEVEEGENCPKYQFDPSADSKATDKKIEESLKVSGKDKEGDAETKFRRYIMTNNNFLVEVSREIEGQESRMLPISFAEQWNMIQQNKAEELARTIANVQDEHERWAKAMREKMDELGEKLEDVEPGTEAYQLVFVGLEDFFEGDEEIDEFAEDVLEDVDEDDDDLEDDDIFGDDEDDEEEDQDEDEDD